MTCDFYFLIFVSLFCICLFLPCSCFNACFMYLLTYINFFTYNVFTYIKIFMILLYELGGMSVNKFNLWLIYHISKYDIYVPFVQNQKKCYTDFTLSPRASRRKFRARERERWQEFRVCTRSRTVLGCLDVMIIKWIGRYYLELPSTFLRKSLNRGSGRAIIITNNDLKRSVIDWYRTSVHFLFHQKSEKFKNRMKNESSSYNRARCWNIIRWRYDTY